MEKHIKQVVNKVWNDYIHIIQKRLYAKVL